MRTIDVDRLKTEIDLLAVASEYGYRLNKRKSTANSIHLKSDADSLVVKRDGDGRWVYFNVHDGNDKGSIIDFIMYRKSGVDFYEAVNWIEEEYFGRVIDTPEEFIGVSVSPVKKDRDGVVRLFLAMRPLEQSVYLNGRGISDSILKSNRFYRSVYEDSFRNVVFPHFDELGVCGFEKRNRNFKGFPKGGTKSLWLSNRLKSDSTMIIVESGIDALSHYALFKTQKTRYLSIGGEPSPAAWVLIGKIINKYYQAGGKIVSGVDNDDGGFSLDEKLRALAATPITRSLPKNDDWNEMLKLKLTERKDSCLLR